MKINEALKWGAEYLSRYGIENTRQEAEYLLLELLNCSKSSIYINGDIPLPADVFSSFSRFLEKRAKRIPCQYITGRAWFNSLPFMVDENVMIPRPETEILVEMAIKRCLKKIDSYSPKIADIGTGCGNIAISLAKSISCEVYALDISCGAIDVARKNAEKLFVTNSVTFLCGDVLNLEFELPCNLDLVISNPPYIPRSDFGTLPVEVREFEPRIALDGGKDGIEFYPPIIQLASKALSSGGYLALEVGIGQAKAVERIIFENGSYQHIETISDYQGIERVVIAQKRKAKSAKCKAK